MDLIFEQIALFFTKQVNSNKSDLYENKLYISEGHVC